MRIAHIHKCRVIRRTLCLMDGRGIRVIDVRKTLAQLVELAPVALATDRIPLDLTELTLEATQLRLMEHLDLTPFSKSDAVDRQDRKSTRLNSSHVPISYA